MLLEAVGLWCMLLGSGLGDPNGEKAAIAVNTICYWPPLIVFDPLPLSEASAACSLNGFTLQSIPPSGSFASGVSSIISTNCAGFPASVVVAQPSCSTFNLLASSGAAAPFCGASFPVMCILPAPSITTSIITASALTVSRTTTSVALSTTTRTSTIVFLSGTTTFIVQASTVTAIVTVPSTSTISVINTVSTTVSTTLVTTTTFTSLSATTTTTTASLYSITQTTTSTTLTLTVTLTLSSTDTTTTTTTTCPPTSYSTATQTTTVTATTTVKTVLSTDSTLTATATTQVTTFEPVCGGPATSTASECCPPGRRCPKLPKPCLSYGQVQTCKHRDRKLLVAFRPADRGEAACVCKAVGGALAVLDGPDDEQAAYELVYSCVGGGGRAWIGDVLGRHADGSVVDWEEVEEASRPCNVVHAIGSDFGVIEQEPCRSKYPILCRYW